ncbi:12099_t:CDS:2, partial [Entrophospora sp. SA101]
PGPDLTSPNFRTSLGPDKSTIIATILDPQAKLSNFQPGSESSSAIPNFRINFKSI